MKEVFKKALMCNDLETLKRILIVIARNVEKGMSNEAQEIMWEKLRQAVEGNHFDKETADKVISGFFYKVPSGRIVSAPFITEEKCSKIFNKNISKILPYNLYDFMVILNDTIANFHNLFHSWWENEDEEIMLIKYTEVAINWLQDDDTSFRGEKVWKVFHA